MGAPRGELSLDFVIGSPLPGVHRRASRLDLAAQKFVVRPRFALALNKLTHQLTQYLRGRTVGCFGLSHELGAQFRLQLHCEDSFF